MVAESKEAGDNDTKGAATPVDAVYVKGLASSVEGATVAEAKEAGAPDAKGAFTPADAGSVNNVAAAEGMACSLEAPVVATAYNDGADVEVVATFVDSCSYRDVAAAKGVAYAVVDTKDASAVEDLDRV